MVVCAELLLVLCMTTTAGVCIECIECEQSSSSRAEADHLRTSWGLSNEAADVGADLGWPSGGAWRMRQGEWQMRGAGETVVH